MSHIPTYQRTERENNPMLPKKPMRIVRKTRLLPSKLKRATSGKMRPSQLRSLKKKLEASQKALVIKKYGRDCFTCPQKNLKKSNCQLGHVPWPRSILSTECKYDIHFTRIQCFRCNIHLGGNGAIALQRMRDEGIDVDAMRALNEATKGKKVPNIWFQEKLADYDMQIKNYG